jgi:hypothetical protein
MPDARQKYVSTTIMQLYVEGEYHQVPDRSSNSKYRKVKVKSKSKVEWSFLLHGNSVEAPCRKASVLQCTGRAWTVELIFIVKHGGIHVRDFDSDRERGAGSMGQQYETGRESRVVSREV